MTVDSTFVLRFSKAARSFLWVQAVWKGFRICRSELVQTSPARLGTVFRIFEFERLARNLGPNIILLTVNCSGYGVKEGQPVPMQPSWSRLAGGYTRCRDRASGRAALWQQGLWPRCRFVDWKCGLVPAVWFSTDLTSDLTLPNSVEPGRFSGLLIGAWRHGRPSRTGITDRRVYPVKLEMF